MVGNDFVLPRPKMQSAVPNARPQPAVRLAPVAASPAVKPVVFETPSSTSRSSWSQWSRLTDLFHRYWLGVFALLFLLVGSSAVQVGAAYWSASINMAASTSAASRIPTQAKQGPNAIIANDQLTSTLHNITTQPLSLTIGAKTVPVAPDTIKSWLQIVSDKKATYIHVSNDTIAKSLTSAAAPYIKEPSNQVTINRADGTSQIIATGRNGTQLGNTKDIANQIGKTVLGAKGMNVTLPIETLPFSAVSAASIDKILEVNVTTKQMWAYDKGQLTRQFPISAGAPETPTPIGQYKIYQKLPIQDMRGYNANGTKYFQPNVRWVNYFLTGGYAVHGNYWRPASFFGNINSSHGCVSLPDDQAKWIYDWAPIGTTVITHT